MSHLRQVRQTTEADIPTVFDIPNNKQMHTFIYLLFVRTHESVVRPFTEDIGLCKKRQLQR